ncbi:MAG: nicotinate-nucleotide adenylyltransferase [Ignavibacteriales bacterium]|nr:nicotinate-nucleotide adenylyltransferase [Ignavibacteriales bacterium]
MRIGIFGGSFDPPHIGHLVIAELACEQLGLDKVIFVPAYLPPHKMGGHRSSPHHRLQMTKIAVKGNPQFVVSDIEIQREGISYTVDTLQYFKKKYPKAKLFLLIGGDNYVQFVTWKSPDVIAKLASLVVYPRPGYDSTVLPHSYFGKEYLLQGNKLDLSSTEIRKRVFAGKTSRYVVLEKVEQYIVKKRLYKK